MSGGVRVAVKAGSLSSAETFCERDGMSAISYQFDNLSGLYYSRNLEGKARESEILFSLDEAELLANLDQAKDLSHGSDELLKEISTPFRRFHLSPERANLLHPFEKILHGHVLQLAAGGGAVARFLAECGCRVRVVEPNENLATLTRSRCRDVDVSVYVAGQDLFPSDIDYDVVVAIDSTAAARLPVADYFGRVKGALKPDGVLIAGINNKLARQSLVGSPDEQNSWCVTQASLEKILLAIGLPNFRLFCAFPSFEVARLIVRPESASRYPAGLGAILAAYEAYQHTLGSRFLREPFWRSILENDLLPYLSNAFLAVASAVPLPVMDHGELLAIYSSFRRKHFARVTKISREGEQLTVSRSPLFPGTPPPSESLYVTRPHREPYFAGKQYLALLQPIVSREGWQLKEVSDWARPWLDLLRAHASDQTFRSYISGFRRLLLLPTDYLDCIPSNIVVNQDGTLIPFDFEYEAAAPIPLNFVVFRGLFYAFSTAAVATSSVAQGTTVLGLALQIMRACGIDLTEWEVQNYVETEASLQHTILGVPREQVAEGLRSTVISVGQAHVVSLTPEHPVTVELFWKHDGTDYTASQSQAAPFAVEKGRQILTLAIPALPVPVHRLRLDPFDRRGAFYIYSLRLFDSTGQRIWSWDGNPAGLRRLNNDFAFADIPGGNDGALVCSESDDPGFELPVSPEVLLNIQGGGRLEVDMAKPEQVPSIRLSRRILDMQVYGERIASLELENRALAAANAGLQGNLQDARNQLERLSAKTMQTERVRDDLAALNRELKEQLSSYGGSIASLSASVENLLAQKARLEADVAAAKRETEKAVAACHASDADQSKLQETIDSITAELNSKIARLNTIYAARGWKALSTYYKLRKAVLRPFELIRDKHHLKQSCLFDVKWYVQTYPDVATAGVDPLTHYLQFGAAEGRDPNPYFDTDWYLKSNPDVDSAGINPLIHYIRHGAAEHRNPSPSFDTTTYLLSHPDSADMPISPLEHFLLNLHVVASPNSCSSRNHEGDSAIDGLEHQCSSDGTPLADRSAESEAAVRKMLWMELNTSRTAESHDDDSYRSVVAELRSRYQNRIRQLVVQQPTAIHIKDERLTTFAWRISFPASDKPLVSIIIPVFNQLHLSLECLSSISLHSVGISYEVIVVDDGSSDETANILSEIDNLVYLKNDSNIGFIRSCNRGAKAARGFYVLLLNNDAQATEGWLAPLIDTFQQFDNVGAVGPKVVFPDGRLQEAGAVVNRDGTTTLVGVFDDPSLPLYNRVREVPYCSGVCLLIERSTFLEAGGFADYLAPAYCEDCDLAFRLRSTGLRVLYNPNSVVIHHLSATVGQSLKQSTAVRNQQKIVERWQMEIDELNTVRLIAFYLPQFHPILENDIWWGKGFTEWTNVAKALPNYVGHYQPHLPADLGFYDLRLDSVREEQALLAKRYGVYGFCYYYYWFAGKRLLEYPLERMLESGKPDLPFCLAWANENWTRRWDGRDQEILMAQQHSDEDDCAVIRDLMRYMSHRNYITIKGKPLLIVYRISLFPSIRRTTEIWRNLCLKEGIGEIYLAMAESFDRVQSWVDPSSMGFDASIEFPPHGMGFTIAPPGEIVNPEFKGTVYDYVQIVKNYLNLSAPGHVRFRCVMPGWDNTARRQNDPVIFEKSTPGAYQAWLEAVIESTCQFNFGDERLVFINAWNEWAEGNHLEPDRRNGHAFLEATFKATQAWMWRGSVPW
jgi:GT2 family glycosyltransferase